MMTRVAVRRRERSITKRQNDCRSERSLESPSRTRCSSAAFRSASIRERSNRVFPVCVLRFDVALVLMHFRIFLSVFTFSLEGAPVLPFCSVAICKSVPIATNDVQSYANILFENADTADVK